MIDLAPEALREVQEALRRHVPTCEVRVFGSRVLGTARPFSDLDLALVSPCPLAAGTLADLKDDLAASDLSVSVDVVEWEALPEGLRTAIGRCYEVIQTGSGDVSRPGEGAGRPTVLPADSS